MKTKIFAILFLGALIFGGTKVEALSIVPPYGGAACNFTRDLGQGSWGEDVRCLQQYLSTTNYNSSYYGGGYDGYQGYMVADGFFGPMTAQAVMQWQTANGIYPAYGYFDAASRAKYFELTGDYGSYGSYGSYGGYGGGYSYGVNTAQQRAHDKMIEALRMIGFAWDEIEDSNRDTASAEQDLEDAQDDLRAAAQEFFAKSDFEDAYDLAVDAFNNAEDAFDRVDGGRSSGDKEDAQDAIEDAEDAIDDAEDEIADARSRGVSQTLINRAEDYLDDARDSLDDAEDEYDDKDYDDAEDSARDAEDFAQDAIDEVN